MIVVLLLFKPPTKDIYVEDIKATRLSFKDVEKLVNEKFVWSFRDIEHLRNQPSGKFRGFEKMYWPALEVPNDSVPRACYIALANLIAGQWAYRLASFTSKSYADSPIPLIKSFTNIFLKQFSAGAKLLSSSRHFRVSMERWSASYTRWDPLDSVLDCCSSLEAAFCLSDELRLRLSLAAYYTAQKNKRYFFKTVYEMYGLRNSFIHGSKIPELAFEQQEKYIKVTADLLKIFIQKGSIPNNEEVSNAIMQKFA